MFEIKLFIGLECLI